MPLFEYRCSACGADFEKLVFSSDSAPVTCPDCSSSEVTKKMSAASLMSGSSGVMSTTAGGCGGGSARPFS